MSAKTYGTWMRVIAAALAALIAVSIVLELPLYVPVLSFMVALVLAGAFRRLVREIMIDERNRRIENKATVTSYRIYTIVTAMVALTVLMLRSSLPSWVGIAGETLAYSLCGLMLAHLASRRYYGKKL